LILLSGGYIHPFRRVRNYRTTTVEVDLIYFDSSLHLRGKLRYEVNCTLAAAHD